MRNTLPPYPESCAPCDDLSKDGWESRHNLGHGQIVSYFADFFIPKNKIKIKSNQIIDMNVPFHVQIITGKLKLKLILKK
jgi:hypothetical protein